MNYMLIFTICVFQNKQVTSIPTINLDKSHKSIETFQSSAFDNSDNKLSEIYQYLIDNYTSTKIFDTFLNENNPVKK